MTNKKDSVDAMDTKTTKCENCGWVGPHDCALPDQKIKKTLDRLKDEVVWAACRWHAADIYVHPFLDRDQAVKVGVADLIDAVQNWKNAQPPTQAKNV
jgi:hypothetical protein